VAGPAAGKSKDERGGERDAGDGHRISEG